MPDWSYQTLFRPLLFRLPSRIARSLTLNAMNRVSRMPGGTLLIKTLGHMEPSPLLKSDIADIPVSAPVGLSGRADPQGIAHRAISQFGFGFIEIGPVTVKPIVSSEPILNDWRREIIHYPNEYENDGLETMKPIIDSPRHRLPQFVRIAPMPGGTAEQAGYELSRLIHALSSEKVAGWYIDILSPGRDLEHHASMLEQAAAVCSASQAQASSAAPPQVQALPDLSAADLDRKPLFLYIPPDFPNDELKLLLARTDLSIWSGYVIGDSTHICGGVETGRSSQQLALSKIEIVRTLAPVHSVIKSAAAVHEPQDALQMLHAGADHLLLGSGLVFSGPGLPKRVNEAIIYDKIHLDPAPEEPSFWKHWGWMCLLGIGMMIGGFIAWLIAASSVVLPYDEQFLGMTRAELQGINRRLLHFMSHDRITLAGTMISIGILYYQLAKNGLKYGQHWARTAVMVSGVVGFPSFFLYLGYGFFDPLHAAAAAVLFPMFLLAMRRNPDQPFRKPVNMRNSREWRLAMWGQLCFVALGVSLCVGGIVIASVGVTYVFVPQDLSFMEITRAELDQANPKLIPLIAHDRAGFGGALLADAVMLLVIALWGIRQGERWLWWTLLAGGSPAFIAGLSVHYGISYTDFIHLLPAYFAAALYVAGLILLYPYMMREESKSR